MKGRVRLLLDEKLPPLTQIRPYHFLWACAFVPIVLLPPLVSFLVSISSMRKRSGGAEFSNFEWIAIVSTLNIIMSGIVLYKFHFSHSELAAYLISFVEYMIDSLSSVLPIQRGTPRLIPI